MEPSPLQLNNHYFTQINLKSEEDANKKTKDSIECEVSFSVNQSDIRQHRVILRLGLVRKHGDCPSYTGEFEVVGQFTIHDSWPEDKIGALITANAPSMLYSAVREMVLNLSLRSKNGPLHLHTVRFAPAPIDIADEIKKRKSDVARSTQKMPRRRIKRIAPSESDH